MNPDELSSSIHRHRIRRILWVSAGLLMGLGAGWLVFFALTGEYVIAAVEFVLLVAGGSVLWLTHLQRTRLAFLLVTLVTYLAIGLFSLYFDVPDAVAPRTSHLYLLVLTLASMLVLRNEPPLLRWPLTGVLILTFVVFASTSWSIPSELSIPASVRQVGVWINAATAMLGMLALVHITLMETAEANSLQRDIERGMARREFFLVFQPQVQADGKVVGAEALLRWRHPQLGMVSPGDFIPVAEESGQILPLGSWVLQEACQTLQRWARTPAMDGVSLSVNVSAKQFLQPDFVGQIASAMQQHGVVAARLKLELTESMLVHDMSDIIAKMHSLHTLGVGCSLDDFGTGFSSLSYLKKLPLDQIKIDQAFVRDVLTDPSDAAIARAVLQLGENLGLAVIAEGVETEGQRDFLLANHCRLFQGYLYSRPLAAIDFEMYVADNSAMKL
ncbi:putative bifunctional diguanylate cyclase/phosphodiesterase [Rhodoferax mekongensis]|uniref:putative bifunctional diguanylate cyclase/phosphodiesterase n=1 Tax=Rhodoferax mekongensis TaxID=3068341 RepID=UPI0028BD3911|nr:EAL domain-containing protein [Rhodoferax sp. TBRC 17199]MDT7515441.1 EAL domain-containing protein [Rhodoferax sp. TBRC 17199]